MKKGILLGLGVGGIGVLMLGVFGFLATTIIMDGKSSSAFNLFACMAMVGVATMVTSGLCLMSSQSQSWR